MARDALSRRQLVKVLASSALASGLPLSGAESRRFAFTQWEVFSRSDDRVTNVRVGGFAVKLMQGEYAA